MEERFTGKANKIQKNGAVFKMKSTTMRILVPVLLIVIGAGFIYAMNYSFDHSDLVRDIFCGTPNPGDVLGRLDPGAPNTIAAQNELTGRISMLIFATITVLQFVAFGVAYLVLQTIRRSGESFKLRLKKLENADIFFDVPLYVGLFGTVSAFLVMTFSPQSSRLIAYSSTLIGILFSLFLRVAMLYPLRQKLLSGTESNEEKNK